MSLTIVLVLFRAAKLRKMLFVSEGTRFDFGGISYLCDMAKNKFYVVWAGRTPGIYDNWNVCKAEISGFPGAHYKGFPNREDAEAAYNMGFDAYKSSAPTVKAIHSSSKEKPVTLAIAVDAACSGNPGRMEYRGVFVDTGTELFKSPVFENGTNNIGEFLAIVHALAYQKKHKLTYPIYSDSVNAQLWIRHGKCKTKLKPDARNRYLFELVSRAETWLATNTIDVPILKWKTSEWGEIPADFGRK